jgi:hypothetical protein
LDETLEHFEARERRRQLRVNESLEQFGARSSRRNAALALLGLRLSDLDCPYDRFPAIADVLDVMMDALDEEGPFWTDPSIKWTTEGLSKENSEQEEEWEIR